jgi:mono/diheme cytochrome c family protein
VSCTTPTRWTVGVFVASLGAASIFSVHNLAGSVADDSWSVPSRAARLKNPVKMSPVSIAAGKAIYADQCICCHGSAGRGDGPSASGLDCKPDDLTDRHLLAESDGVLFWKITHGREPMPGFDSLVSAESCWNVINYVRTLGPKPTTAASTQE